MTHPSEIKAQGYQSGLSTLYLLLQERDTQLYTGRSNPVQAAAIAACVRALYQLLPADAK